MPVQSFHPLLDWAAATAMGIAVIRARESELASFGADGFKLTHTSALKYLSFREQADAMPH